MPIFFSKQFSLNSFNSKSGGLWCQTTMPGPGAQDFIFQHPLLSLKGALRAISKNTNNVFFKCYCICLSTQKIMLKSPQLWAPWLQDSSFHHPFTLKLALKGYQKMPITFIQRCSMLNNFQKNSWKRQQK